MGVCARPGHLGLQWIHTREDRRAPGLPWLAVLERAVGAAASPRAEGRPRGGVQAVSGVLRPRGDRPSTALGQEGSPAFQKRTSRHAGSLRIAGRRGDGPRGPHVVPADAPDRAAVPSLHPPPGRWAGALRSLGKCCPKDMTRFL